MHAEVVAVAEVVHFKVLNLLLHQQALPQALGQLREHLALWGPVPGEACGRRGPRTHPVPPVTSQKSRQQ
jgi:hypothetical protein